jgi:hypothetical protein
VSINFSIFRPAGPNESLNNGLIVFGADEYGWVAKLKPTSSTRVDLQIDYYYSDQGPYDTTQIPGFNIVTDTRTFTG